MSRDFMMMLPAGTVLFHGTDNDDFVEAEDSLGGPAWLSRSRSVAEHFARRSGGWGGRQRVVEYVLSASIELCLIVDARGLQTLARKHNIDLSGVEGMRESVERSGLPGWIIPNNYPDGDDILIVSTDVLDFVQTHDLSAVEK